MIPDPEQVTSDVLKDAVLSVVPGLPERWQAELRQKWLESGAISGLIWLSLDRKTLNVDHVTRRESIFWLSYADLDVTDAVSARHLIEADLAFFGGYVFDWNTGDGGRVCNMGVILPAL